MPDKIMGELPFRQRMSARSSRETSTEFEGVQDPFLDPQWRTSLLPLGNGRAVQQVRNIGCWQGMLYRSRASTDLPLAGFGMPTFEPAACRYPLALRLQTLCHAKPSRRDDSLLSRDRPKCTARDILWKISTEKAKIMVICRRFISEVGRRACR